MQALIPAQNNLTLEELAANIKVALTENFVNTIKIGAWLTDAKSQLPHGQWQFWLAENFCENFNLTVRTARRYMKIFEYFGENSILKTDNVVRFKESTLLELTKLTKQEVSKFLAAQEEAGVDAASLSVTQVQKAIKEWKNPSLPLTVDVQAEIATAPLQLPPPQFATIPTDLIAAADCAGLKIKNPCDIIGACKQNQNTGSFYMPLLERSFFLCTILIVPKVNQIRKCKLIHRAVGTQFVGGSTKDFIQLPKLQNFWVSQKPLLKNGANKIYSSKIFLTTKASIGTAGSASKSLNLSTIKTGTSPIGRKD